MFQQSSNQQIVSRSKGHAAGILLFLLTLALWWLGYLALYENRNGEFLRILSTAAMSAFGLLAIYQAIRLASLGKHRPAPLILWGGVLFIVIGIGFDVIVTLRQTPDLANEGNPIMITLREARLQDWFLYSFMILAQAGNTVLSFTLWIAFLRHASTYLDLLWAMDPVSLFQFLAVGLGFNLRRSFLRWRPGLAPRAYRLLWICALCYMNPLRNYFAGLQWLNIIPHTWSPWTFNYAVMAATPILFLLWLTGAYISRRFPPG